MAVAPAFQNVLVIIGIAAGAALPFTACTFFDIGGPVTSPSCSREMEVGQSVMLDEKRSVKCHIFLFFSYEIKQKISVKICVFIMTQESGFNTTTTDHFTFVCLFSDSRFRALPPVHCQIERSRRDARLLVTESTRASGRDAPYRNRHQYVL